MNNKFKVKDYQNKISSGQFNDCFVYGLRANHGGFNTAEVADNNATVFAGDIRSGKSNACFFAIFTHFLSDGHRSLYVLIDTKQDLKEFSELKEKDNFVFVREEEKIEALFKDLFLELSGRAELFHKSSCHDLKAYERKTGNSITRLVIVVENLLSIYRIFSKNKTNINETDISRILRIGRNYGIYFLGVFDTRDTEIVKNDELPHDFNRFFSRRHVFRTSNAKFCRNFIKHTSPTLIKQEEPWKAYNEWEEVFFPFITRNIQRRLLKINKQEFKINTQHIALDIFRKAYSYNSSARVKKCDCHIVTLMRTGCKCGGI